MNSLTLSSPAKLNLYLKVLGRRPDGYHDLLTLFHRISLADTMALEKAPRFSLHCSKPGLSTGKDNLIAKAYRIAKQEIPKLGGVKVTLLKNIPMGAGLGGGSGNAATLLLGINKLYGLKLKPRDLYRWGRNLGADVCFFLHNMNQAAGTGRGDEIIPRPVREKYWFVLALSEKGLSTPEVYQKLPRKLPAVSLTKASHDFTILCNSLDGKKLRRAESLMENDLEGPAFRLRPFLRRAVSNFEKLGKTARMSGSGTTLFSIFSGVAEANAFAKKLQPVMPSQKIVVCHTV